jgi:hypothetical protein
MYLFVVNAAFPFFPFATAAMGGLGFLENSTLASRGWFDPHHSVDTLPLATPVVANTAHFFAAIKIHFDSSFYSCFSKNSLPTPQLGQNQLSGRSSKAVPGAMPPSESPAAGS